MTGNVLLEKVVKNVGKVIIGKEDIVTLLLTVLLADGHVLLEDVPGTGKTKVAKSFPSICKWSNEYGRQIYRLYMQINSRSR